MADLINPGAIFGSVKSLRDLNVENAVKNQALQEGDIKNANAANLYRTQVLTGAIASGDQNIYNQALTHLGQRGIDVSDLAPDIATGSQQIQAMRQAQYSANPLNAMLGLGLKAEANGIAAGGTTPEARAAAPLSAAIAGRMLGGSMPGAISPPSLPAASGGAEAAPDAAGAFASLPVTAGLKNGSPMPVEGSASGFMPPVRNQGETAAAWKDRVNLALEQWKTDPSTVKNTATAKNSGDKLGDEIGEAAKTVNIMQSNLPMVLQRFEKMRQASKNSSSGFGVDNEGEGWAQKLANSSVGSDETSQANNVLMQAAAQGILPELGPQLQQAGVKGNKFLESIATSASGLNMSAKPADKLSLINGLETTYINNLKSSAAQLRAAGQPAPSDDEIDAAVSKYLQSAPTSGAAVKNIPMVAAKALMANPDKAAEFDAKFGAGAAKSVLGR